MQNKGYYAVQGHSRSSKSVSIESPYATYKMYHVVWRRALTGPAVGALALPDSWAMARERMGIKEGRKRRREKREGRDEREITEKGATHQ